MPRNVSRRRETLFTRTRSVSESIRVKCWKVAARNRWCANNFSTSRWSLGMLPFVNLSIVIRFRYRGRNLIRNAYVSRPKFLIIRTKNVKVPERQVLNRFDFRRGLSRAIYIGITGFFVPFLSLCNQLINRTTECRFANREMSGRINAIIMCA